MVSGIEDDVFMLVKRLTCVAAYFNIGPTLTMNTSRCGFKQREPIFISSFKSSQLIIALARWKIITLENFNQLLILLDLGRTVSLYDMYAYPLEIGHEIDPH